MADVYLVCEGPADGLDSRALDAVVAQILRVPVIVSPAGGDSSLASVASWLEERSRRTRKDGTLGPPSDRAFSIEDRDYRPRAEADASWHTKGNKRLMWRRHEVENYLLEPGVVLRAFDSLRRTVTFPWARKLPTEELAVAELLADLARPMSEDHAGRLLHWELRRAKGNAGVTDLPLPSPTTAPGARYPGRDQWIEAIERELDRLRRDCLAVAHLKTFDAHSVRARYDELLAGIRQPEFIQSRQFLSDMGGHELLSALAAHLRTLGATQLSEEDLEDELVNALVSVYRPRLYQPDDFAELAQRLTLAAGSQC